MAYLTKVALGNELATFRKADYGHLTIHRYL